MFLVSLSLALLFTVPAFGTGVGIAVALAGAVLAAIADGLPRSSAASPSTTTSPSRPPRLVACSSRSRCWGVGV